MWKSLFKKKSRKRNSAITAPCIFCSSSIRFLDKCPCLYYQKKPIFKIIPYHGSYQEMLHVGRITQTLMMLHHNIISHHYYLLMSILKTITGDAYFTNPICNNLMASIYYHEQIAIHNYADMNNI